MSEKKKFLVGYRESAVVPLDAEREMESFAGEEAGIQIVRKLKTGQHIFEMTEEQAAKLAEQHVELVIEEDKELELFLPMPGLAPRLPLQTELTVEVKVVDENTQKPLKDVTIFCSGEEITYKGITDGAGMAKVKIFEPALKHIIASPQDNYWSKYISSPNLADNLHLNFALQELTIKGSYGWGHLEMGIDKINKNFTGKGIKVAVIDSGIVKHEDLITTGGYNTLDGQDPKAWYVDEKGHGTHVSGIISAQINQIGVSGVAPGAEIYSLKVFPGGKFSDLIEAINWCVDNYMDVISMSLGSPTFSDQIQMALSEANERGIVCIAAAGNDGGPVAYPAAYENVIAVSAIGKVGTFPEDSAHQLKMGDYFSADGQIFLAKFSNFGPQINFCAPGVAIISSVPAGYASWDGTSMACPLITGLAALILEAYPEIRTGDVWQPYYVREVLRSVSVDLGLPAEMQGAGLPNAEIALSSAIYRQEYQTKLINSYRNYLETMLQSSKDQTARLEEVLSTF